LKRSVIITLLFVLMLFQAMGWLLAWCLAQAQARKEATQNMLQVAAPMLHLACSEADFRQNKVGRKEIRWEGHLYDIKSITKQGDSLRLTLHHDEREERLFFMLGKLLHPQKALHPSAPMPLLQWLVNWLITVYLLPEALPFAQKMASSPLLATFFYLFSLPSAPALRIFSPPWWGGTGMN